MGHKPAPRRGKRSGRLLPDMAADAELAQHLLALMDAGRRMVGELEKWIAACSGVDIVFSNGACPGCKGCRPSRRAIRRWAGAVVRLREREARRIDGGRR